MDQEAAKLLSGMPFDGSPESKFFVLKMNFKPTAENVAFEREFQAFCDEFTDGGRFMGLKLLYAYGAPDANVRAVSEELQSVKGIVARQVEELEMRIDAKPKPVEKKTFGA